MKHLRKTLLICFALCALMLSAQQAPTKKQWKKVASIAYSCELPQIYAPQQIIPKKSYTITVSAESITVKLSKEGSKDSTFIFPSSSQTLAKLKTHLTQQKLMLTPEVVEIWSGMPFFEILTCYDATGNVVFGGAQTPDGGNLSLQTGKLADGFMELLPMTIDEMYQQMDAQVEQARLDAERAARQYITEEEWAATTRAVFRFTDSSTAPQFHRSYIIEICADSIVVSISSYRDELLRKVYPFTAEQFTAVKQELASQGIYKGKKPDTIEPTGGTARSLAFYNAESSTPFFSASEYAGIGTLYVENGGAGQAFVKALPESLQELIESTRTIPQ